MWLLSSSLLLLQSSSNTTTTLHHKQNTSKPAIAVIYHISFYTLLGFIIAPSRKNSLLKDWRGIYKSSTTSEVHMQLTSGSTACESSSTHQQCQPTSEPTARVTYDAETHTTTHFYHYPRLQRLFAIPKMNLPLACSPVGSQIQPSKCFRFVFSAFFLRRGTRATFSGPSVKTVLCR